MSLDPQPLPKNINRIEIVLSTKNSVVSKSGSLKCHMTQDGFQFVERLLWHQMMETVSTKGGSNTLSVATCQSEERTQ